MENVLVSDEDRHLLENYKWYIGKDGYVSRTIKGCDCWQFYFTKLSKDSFYFFKLIKK